MVYAAGEMSDAAEVLNVVTDRLDATEAGAAMARTVWGCHIREQMHCLRCGRDTRQKAYCQYLFTASASGLREQASVMRHGDEGDQAPVVVRALLKQAHRLLLLSQRAFLCRGAHQVTAAKRGSPRWAWPSCRSTRILQAKHALGLQPIRDGHVL